MSGCSHLSGNSQDDGPYANRLRITIAKSAYDAHIAHGDPLLRKVV